jgi:hypothetical protein
MFGYYKVKCCFCQSDRGMIRSVCEHGIYGEQGKRLFFHQECLEMIEMEPEKYGNINVDMAIYINNLIEVWSKKINLVEEFQEKLTKLRQQSFSRMMPKVK